MGQLNIKDEALIADARRLADELGTSVTGAVRAAVDAMLTQRDADKVAKRAVKIEAVKELGARVRAATPPHLRTSDHADLYDKDGLPT